MAKVINQDIPAQEVLDDADPQRPFTVGDAYAQALTEGHKGAVPSGTLVVQKSPRQGRSGQRGEGSAAQKPQRDCFKCCAAMWRAQVGYFKNCVKDAYNQGRPPAKDKQIPPEWFSTPYSTFMQKCLKACRASGDCEFDPYNLFPCPDPECVASTIGYTTTSMQTSETQQFMVVNPHEGAAYTWQVGSGGGSISGTGLYTAPGTNPNCDQNPIIHLTCNGLLTDTLQLTINGYGQPCVVAYVVYEYRDMTYNLHSPPTENDGMCCVAHYNCLGEKVACSCVGGPGCSLYCTTLYPASCCTSYFPLNGTCDNTGFTPALDARTPEMKAGGCCPPGLM